MDFLAVVKKHILSAENEEAITHYHTFFQAVIDGRFRGQRPGQRRDQLSKDSLVEFKGSSCRTIVNVHKRQ